MYERILKDIITLKDTMDSILSSRLKARVQLADLSSSPYFLTSVVDQSQPSVDREGTNRLAKKIHALSQFVLRIQSPV